MEICQYRENINVNNERREEEEGEKGKYLMNMKEAAVAARRRLWLGGCVAFMILHYTTISS